MESGGFFDVAWRRRLGLAGCGVIETGLNEVAGGVPWLWRFGTVSGVIGICQTALALLVGSFALWVETLTGLNGGGLSKTGQIVGVSRRLRRLRRI